MILSSCSENSSAPSKKKEISKPKITETNGVYILNQAYLDSVGWENRYTIFDIRLKGDNPPKEFLKGSIFIDLSHHEAVNEVLNYDTSLDVLIVGNNTKNALDFSQSIKSHFSTVSILEGGYTHPKN